MPIQDEETHPQSPSVPEIPRTAALHRTWIEAGIALADNPDLVWSCRILDISSGACALYCEEPTPQLAAVLLSLPGLEDSIIGRIVADHGFVKHLSFALPLDLARLMPDPGQGT